MLVCFGLASGLFALMSLIGILWSVLLVWVALLIGAHVFANAWGTCNGERRAAPEPDRSPPASHPPEPLAIVPPTQLTGSLGRGTTPLIVGALGGIAGGGLIGTLLSIGPSPMQTVSLAGIALGAVSATAIGGLLGFLAGSFYSVSSRAWREAAGGEQADRGAGG